MIIEVEGQRKCFKYFYLDRVCLVRIDRGRCYDRRFINERDKFEVIV